MAQSNHFSNRSTPSNQSLSNDEKAKIKRIITADEEGKELIGFADSVADRIVKDGMTTSQIRLIFSEARQIEAFWEKDPTSAKRRLTLLKPKLLYQATRESKVNYYADVFHEAIIAVEDAANVDSAFEKLMDFFEATLAYHKKRGGRD